MFHFQTDTDAEEDVLILDDIESGLRARLIVHNDDFNTFDWVIKSLVDVCGHNAAQAEQISLIVHYKGKATVKSGPKSELKPLKDGLTDRGLSVTIEEEEEN
jgi:ATP-dependent Clp protease adaptor protein ClpS